MTDGPTERRIAYLTGEYPRATDTFIQREVAALRACGLSIHTFSVRRPGHEHALGPEQQAEHQSTFYILPVSPRRLVAAHLAQLVRSPRAYLAAARLAWQTRAPGLGHLLYQLFYFAEAAVVARHCRAQRIDHLHNHFANSSCSLTMLAATMAKRPFSFTLHGPQIFFEPERWALGEKIKRAAFVACISHFCRSQAMIFAAPEHHDKLAIVHCGIDPGLFTPSTPAARPTRLLFVGRLAPVKGLTVLLEAFHRLLPDHPDLQLDILGDGPWRERLESLAHALGLEHAVHFRGYQSQPMVRNALAQSDLFVLPSFAEGVPVVLMEALAAGVPCVATHIAGIPELIEHQSTGLLVPPGDIEALTGQIHRLLTEAPLRAALAEAGRQKVSARFNLHREAAKLAQLFAGQAPTVSAPERIPGRSPGRAAAASGFSSAGISHGGTD